MIGKNRWPSVLAAAFSFAIASPAVAFTGNDLHAALSDARAESVDLYIQGVLDGYLIGSLDIGLTASVEAISEGRSLNGMELARRGTHCVKFPKNEYNIRQLRDVVKKFLVNNPEVRHQSGGPLVLQAVSKTFSCK